ncbi:DHH family phosphoesterase [Scatolibacter rhodanostii]|uniref:DHH family phosphoesterase n=1 Tax=Scatolibacter rhodanostii TaxID=2014781 RepID=UPI0013564C89|nr:DHH family phosphoesterase [Scatolibacter rhodanostii]
MTIQDVAKKLKEQDNILILSHVSPDGDTLGSACALFRGLEQLGKRVSFRCGDEIPAKYTYLFEGLKISSFEPDFVVAVDAATLHLLGDPGKEYEGKMDMAIDHHISHIPFAELDYVDHTCAANCEIIEQLLKAMNVSLDEAMANAIYTGISTDTGCFRYRSVTPQTHRIAAEMMELGADSGTINQIMFETKTKEQMDAEVEAIGSIEYLLDGKCAMIAVTKEMMERTGVSDADLDPIVAKPRQIVGVLIGATLKEKNGGFKISVRTNEPANAYIICQKLGGGGHKAAGGCFVAGDLPTARDAFIKACEEYAKESGL